MSIKACIMTTSPLLALRQPLAARFRALFILRNIGCDLSVEWIGKCFGDSSALLKHELAYCLGQTGNKSAIPLLSSVLEDENQGLFYVVMLFPTSNGG